MMEHGPRMINSQFHLQFLPLWLARCFLLLCTCAAEDCPPADGHVLDELPGRAHLQQVWGWANAVRSQQVEYVVVEVSYHSGVYRC